MSENALACALAELARPGSFPHTPGRDRQLGLLILFLVSPLRPEEWEERE
jgi:hypothetical protein